MAALLHGSRIGARRQRALWLAFLVAMLAFNAYPTSDLAHRGYPAMSVVLVLAGQVVLADCWVRTMWLATATVARSRRLSVWLSATCVLGAGLALGMGGNFKGLLIYVSIACAFALPLRWVVPAVALTTALGAVAEFRNARFLGIAAGGRLNEIVAGESLIFFLGLAMFLARRTMLLVIELRAARAELAEMSVTQERLRFARDLHDLLGHSLTTIALKAQLARRLAPDGSPVAQQVHDIETVTARALTEVREAVAGYRQSDLAAELDAARTLLAAAGVEARVDADASVPLPMPGPQDAVFAWVVHEAVTNILRHSAAGQAEIVLTRVAGGVMLRVSDNGVGPRGHPHTPVAGNGLAGLAERLAAVGGRLTAGPSPERGFRLTASVPCVGGRAPGGTASEVRAPRPVPPREAYR